MTISFKTVLYFSLLCVVLSTRAADNPQCVGDDHSTWTNCRGTLETENLYFIGGFVDGAPDGEGVLRDAFGTNYQGEFREGKKEGRGEMTFGSEHPLSGSTYVGQFKNDMPHGHGLMNYSNGATYTGGYQLGQFHGHGSMLFSNGDHYRGSYKDGLKEGFGVYTYVDGARYEGRWRNDQEHGLSLIHI